MAPIAREVVLSEDSAEAETELTDRDEGPPSVVGVVVRRAVISRTIVGVPRSIVRPIVGPVERPIGGEDRIMSVVRPIVRPVIASMIER